ncbi:MAG TPA: hypothetical protein VMV57_04510 [Terracidiphilus sp.]|nr:hypothetical protein [Terracidiphilus sp.]
MRFLAGICAAALLASVPACSAQYTHHKKPAKPAPTAPELAEYIRGSLLSLSPDDGINDNQEVTFDAASQVMTVKQPDGRCDIFLNSLDANTVIWDVFDASDTAGTREKILRVTIISLSGKPARTCYDQQNHVVASIADNRARLLFALYKTDQMPGFADKMTKALQDLIALSGGLPAKSLF